MDTFLINSARAIPFFPLFVQALKFKVLMPANPLERRFSTWIGAWLQRVAVVTGTLLLFCTLFGLAATHLSYACMLQVGPSWHLWARFSSCGCHGRSMRNMGLL